MSDMMGRDTGLTQAQVDARVAALAGGYAPVQSVNGATGATTVTLAALGGITSAQAPVQSVAGRTGAITLGTGDLASGRLAMARMPDGTAGNVLQGAGASSDPAWVAGSQTASTTPPAFAALVTVPATINRRIVHAVVSAVATVGNLAYVALEVETGVATGAYQEMSRLGSGAGLTFGAKATLIANVLPGYRYRFTKGGLAGVTESIDLYGFTDY